MNRCYTTTNKDYPSIGGAGITVCPDWHTYTTFVNDMGEKPENAILARHVGSLGFTKDNTYWLIKVNTRSNRLYSIWKGAKRRTSTKEFRTYALRGITMSPDWVDSFEQFELDVGQPPTDAHQLDRIDNNAGYWPGNIRWVVSKVNANNRETNVVLTIDGETKTLQEWGEYFGVDRVTITSRWALLFQPAKRKNRAVEQYNTTGQLLATYVNAKTAAEGTSISIANIQKCLCDGNRTAGGYIWRYKAK